MTAGSFSIIFGADDTNECVSAVRQYLRANYETTVVDPTSWPELSETVARGVAAGLYRFGVLMCWTGTGTAMAANKVPGVRAALAWDPWIAEGARRWNDANVLVMSLKRTEPETARAIVDAWLSVEEPDADEAENIAKLD